MLLELKDINKSYENGSLSVPVLFDINFNVEEGEYVSIMGPSGSGKSTLMNIIGCLDVANSGTYKLLGEDISGKSDNELADIRNRSIGFVFQNFNLLPRETALSNVALPLLYAGIDRTTRIEMAKEALINVGLEDRMDYNPTQLSGGQKQRVAIARAMVLKPRLLLADEPTGALDTASGHQIMDIFDELNAKGTSIIMITHEKEIAERAKRQMFILDGRLHSMNGEEVL